MALLKAEPSEPVRTLDELIALASELERSAARTYDGFARRMRQEGADVLAELFERLAAEEHSHVEIVARWAEREVGRPPDPSHIRWPPPDTMDAEGIDALQPQLLTPYRALSVAVRNEERAFVFWSYVAAHADTAEIRRAAEGLAATELEHVALLRRHRRRAYHEMRLKGRDVQSTAAMELALAEAFDRLAKVAKGDMAARLERLAVEARRVASDPDLHTFHPPDEANAPIRPLVEAMDLADALVDRYLEASERVAREEMVAKAQYLAQAAIARLTWLRSNLPSIGADGNPS